MHKIKIWWLSRKFKYDHKWYEDENRKFDEDVE